MPIATIKHYIREGLLPGPTQKTSRNMGYYDPALVVRIRAIKELQEKRFYPLKVIKGLLAGADPLRHEETRAALAKALARPQPAGRRTRAALEASGTPAAQLDFFEQVGLVAPREVDGEVVYEGDDVELLCTLAEARRAGLTAELLPHTIMGPYVAAIRELVRVELALFRRGVADNPDADIEPLVTAAAALSERLVVQLRRKLLLPMLEELAQEGSDASASSALEEN